MPEDRAGITAIQKELGNVLTQLSEPSNAIIISTASKKSIQFATKNVFENAFPPLSPASWNISPITGARYTFDNMLRLTGKVNEWLVARLMEDELSPPALNPLVPARVRLPRIPTSMVKPAGATNSVTEFQESGFWRVQSRGFGVATGDDEDASGSEVAPYYEDATKTSIVRDYWRVLKVISHQSEDRALQLPRVAPEPSSRCVFALQLLSARPARANVRMAARAELWKMSLEYALTDLVRIRCIFFLTMQKTFC